MKTILSLIITILSLSAQGAPLTNQELFQTEVLGRMFCYADEKTAGWMIGSDGTSVRHEIRLGMPGPNSYYKLNYVASLRTLGHFTLVNSSAVLHFQFTPDRILYEYKTGRTLSTSACE